MKIAFITPTVVSHPIAGLQMRLCQFQRVLERIAPGKMVIWDLRENKPADPSGPPSSDRKGAELQSFSSSDGALGSLGDIATFVRHIWPSFVAQSLIEQRDQILAWVDEERPTHAVVVHPYATELVPDLRLRGIQVFVDCHNVESELARQLAYLTPIGREKLHRLLRWRVFERREKCYLPFANEVWVPSEIDTERQRQVCSGHMRVRCVPNALDITQYAVCRHEVTHDIVFPAEFGYRPNIVAAKILCLQVLPIVKLAIPDTRLVLVGRDRRGWAKALHRDPDIIVTGEVQDTRPYLRNAGVIPVPILHGSGTRFKILEAFAQGVPVITTLPGCEGLDVRDGEHLLIREIDQFAAAIVSILLNPSSGQVLGQNGRKLVEARYSWAIVEEIVRKALA